MFQASLSYIVKPLKRAKGWECSSEEEHLPGMHKVMSLIPRIAKSAHKQKTQKFSLIKVTEENGFSGVEISG